MIAMVRERHEQLHRLAEVHGWPTPESFPIRWIGQSDPLMEHAGHWNYDAPQHTGEYHMPSKFFTVVKANQGSKPADGNGKHITSAEEARGEALRQMAQDRKSGYQFDYYIMEAMQVVSTPLPKDVEITDLNQTNGAAKA